MFDTQFSLCHLQPAAQGEIVWLGGQEMAQVKPS